MSKSFDDWFKSLEMSEWIRPPFEKISRVAWNAAIEAAANLLDAKASELQVPDLATGAKWVREHGDEVK